MDEKKTTAVSVAVDRMKPSDQAASAARHASLAEVVRSSREAVDRAAPAQKLWMRDRYKAS